MNVSKTIAEEIAKQMVQPMKKHLEEKKNNLKEYATNIVLGQIPVIILKAYQQHKNFFQSYSCVHFHNGNTSLNYCDVVYGKIPAEQTNRTYTCNNEQFDFMAKERKDIEVLKDELDSTEKSIISTLLSLRTIKKVIESFPDAAPYAEPYLEKKNTTLALPINDISKVLKKYNKK